MAEALASNVRPSMPARLLAAIPLFVLFLEFAFWTRAAPKFETMFREMDLGSLPASTECLLLIGHTFRDFYYLLTPVLFAVCWFYFAWGCKNQQRMLWFAWTVAMFDMAVFCFCMFAYFEPVFDIMERIGK